MSSTAVLQYSQCISSTVNNILLSFPDIHFALIALALLCCIAVSCAFLASSVHVFRVISARAVPPPECEPTRGTHPLDAQIREAQLGHDFRRTGSHGE